MSQLDLLWRARKYTYATQKVVRLSLRVAAPSPRRPSANIVSPPSDERSPAQSATASAEQSLDVEQELEQWNAARKKQSRTFREPWRSFSFAAALGFGASSWLLPESVADVVQLVTSVLVAVGFIAGFRPSLQSNGFLTDPPDGNDVKLSLG